MPGRGEHVGARRRHRRLLRRRPSWFLSLPWEALGLPVAHRTAARTEAPIRLVWARAAGPRLQLLRPASGWAQADSLCPALLPSSSGAAGPQLGILRAVQPTDFHQGLDAVAALCRGPWQQDPFSGALFVFRNRPGTALKLVVSDGMGFW